MKNHVFLPLFFALLAQFSFVSAQMERIDQAIDPVEAESHLRFLTADELRGRNTGSPELIVAGRYIAEQFRRYGLAPLGDQEGDYLQWVPLTTARPPAVAEVSMFGQDLKKDAAVLMISGSNTKITAPLVFLPDLAAFDPRDVKDKVVLTVLRDARSALRNQDPLRALEEAGARGLIQLFGTGQRLPWRLIVNYLSRERMQIGNLDGQEERGFTHIWVLDTANTYVPQWTENPESTVSIHIEGRQISAVKAFNVVGKIEGTDPVLKNEHIVMCAHYDHVGVQAGQGQDSIYNGTRDNGIGTTGLINAAKYFGMYPPKRSVVIIALTGEEKGLLGSQYYVQAPKIPLKETVFAFNIDNSGYTTTDVITLLDTNRTNIDPLVYQAASEAGLGVIGDRLPSQNYYERSDQVSFASAGVPAVNFKMSMVAFDERITKYYHQPEDEFHTVDLDYIHKYWKTYIRSAELLGNWEKRPYWVKGDKFEPAGNKLYEIE